MSKKIFNKVFIVGIGLIGGSFLKAIKKSQIAEKYYAYDDDFSSLKKAIDENLIDNILTFEDDISDVDLIVIASPISSYKKIFAQLAKQNLTNCLIIDVGSIKNFSSSIIPSSIKENFIPCHPIAGSDKSGFINSDGDLFRDKNLIVCLDKKLIKESKKYQNFFEKISQISEKIGSKILLMNSVEHDKIFALVSHLPQFLSFLTAEFSIKKSHQDCQTIKRIFRLDSSNQTIWSDIFSINEKNLEKYYSQFFDNLETNIRKIDDINLLKNEAKKTLEMLDENQLQKKYLQESLAEFLAEKNYLNQLIEKNFIELLFRFLVVLSYLQIDEIKDSLDYAASGFRDFVSIIFLAEEIFKNEEMIKKNKSNLVKILSNFN